MAEAAGMQEDLRAIVDSITAEVKSLSEVDRSLQMPLTLLYRMNALETLLSHVYSFCIRV